MNKVMIKSHKEDVRELASLSLIPSKNDQSSMREVAVTAAKIGVIVARQSFSFMSAAREYLAPAGTTARPRTRYSCEIMPGRTSSPRLLQRLLAFGVRPEPLHKARRIIRRLFKWWEG